MRAPAASACAITASTSSLDATLCPSVNSAALGGPKGTRASFASDSRGYSASTSPPSSWMKTTAPSWNSVPMIPSVCRPIPSR